jgi:gas vesicle structural protein
MSSMAMQRGAGAGYVQRGGGGLYEIVDVLLDKGLVIDVFLRVSLVGIELLTVDARIVLASVDTYLRFAEAVNRLDLNAASSSEGLPELMEDMTEGGAENKTKGVLQGAKETLFGSSDDGDDKDDQDSGSDSSSSRGSGSSSRASSSSSRAASSGSGSRSRSGSSRGRAKS